MDLNDDDYMLKVKMPQTLTFLLLLWPSLCLADLELRSPLFVATLKNTGELSTSSEQVLVSASVNTKTPGHYSLKITIENPSATEEVDLSPLELSLNNTISAFDDPLGGYGSDIHAYLTPFVADAKHVSAPNMGSEVLEWFGLYNRYDVEAVRSSTVWVVDKENTLHPTHAQIVTPGDTIELEFDYIVIQRKKNTLIQLGLDTTLLRDLWYWFRGLCWGIWVSLELLFELTGNWGVAIIALALLIRLFTIPITRISLDYQLRALEQQRRIAPKIVNIKQTYTGVALSEQMIAIYENERYDQAASFKGMLGLFIQIPILIALFTVIGEMSELHHASFLWINDLSLSDRLFPLGIDIPFFGGYFNVLPFLMAGVTILSTWFASQRSETPTVSLFGMAILFFVFFYSFPAALVLYWFASNLFQLLQQLLQHTRKADETV